MADTGPDLERARRILDVEAEAIRRVRDRIGPDFSRAVDVLFATEGKVIVTGLGKSGIICRKIAATLASTGTPAIFLHAAEAGHGDLGTVLRGDSVVAVSNSGETREVVAMIPSFKRIGLPLVAMTGACDSTLARAADVVLDVSVETEACPLALAPTSSTTASLAMGDALALVVMERRGFRETDFAYLHPDGNLGRRLLAVRDLMHRGREMPLVPEDAPMSQAISEITGKRLGHTGVVDSEGKLVGVVSDGDLRRFFQQPDASLDRPVRDAMTPGPKTIRSSALGAEAVAIMEQHAITALFTVDGKGRPEGILHLHDLLKAGVV